MKKYILIILCGILIINVTECFSKYAVIEKNEYQDISTLSEYINTKYLFKYNDTLYSISEHNAVIDIAECTEFIGSINGIINENYIPLYNGETNNEELLDAKVCYANNKSSMIILSDGSQFLFDAVNYGKELFMLGHTLDDGRVFHFASDVPYLTKNTKTTLFEVISNNKITLDKITDNLKLNETYRDGGSKLYEYNPKKKMFGDESFYLLVCNSSDKIDDIYLAKNKETLTNKCKFKVDDIKEIKMTIKKGTLTNKSATVIITDNSKEQYIYGSSYFIQKYENDVWNDIKPLHDLVFTSQGYYINGSMEFNINWEHDYGELESGKYRILKDFGLSGEGTEHYSSVEFNLESNSKEKKIEEKINKIVENGPVTSSNPFDYIEKNKKVYNELLASPNDTFKYAIKDLINNQRGLKGYIEAKLCSDINKNFKYDFENPSDYLEYYKKYLYECDCIYNEYDEYTISLLKPRDTSLDFYITKPKELIDDIRFNEYYKADDRTIYLSGNLSDFYIKDSGKTISLKKYLRNSNQTMDNSIKKITDNLELKDALYDGGSKIYKSKDKNITMIVCNTTKSDKNIFIGDYKLEYKDGDCKN